MPRILYTVRATLPTVQLRSRYLAWLVPDHIAAIKAGGAESVRVILPDRATEAAPVVVEAHFIFPLRQVFDTYVRVHAPALRADSASHFPPETASWPNLRSQKSPRSWNERTLRAERCN